MKDLIGSLILIGIILLALINHGFSKECGYSLDREKGLEIIFFWPVAVVLALSDVSGGDESYNWCTGAYAEERENE